MGEDTSVQRRPIALEDIRREDVFCPNTGEFLMAKFFWIDPKSRAYRGQLKKRSNDLTLDDINRHLKSVADSTAFPMFEEEWMARAEVDDGKRLHIKTPNLLRLDDKTRGSDAVATKLKDEIIALERIRQYHPHPNYVGYYGVMCWRGYATGIVQEKFAVTLANRLAAKQKPLDVTAVIGRIRATLNSLHQHGLAHNNIVAENIGLTADDEAKILNFSCCKPFGEQLIDPGAAEADDLECGVSSQIHDLMALRRLDAWLRKEHAAYHPPSPSSAPRVRSSLATLPAAPAEDGINSGESDSVFDAVEEAGGWALVGVVRA